MRGYSTEYKEHQGLVHKFAWKYWTRVQAAKLPGIEFEDVVGELGIAFTKAIQGYKPESGFTFTAYFGVCSNNHVNKWLGKASREQYGTERPDDNAVEGETISNRGLGMVSLEELTDDADSMFATEDMGPQERCIAAQTLGAIIRDESLAPETKAYISILVNPSLSSPRLLKQIVSQQDTVRQQIRDRWHVSIPSLND